MGPHILSPIKKALFGGMIFVYVTEDLEVR